MYSERTLMISGSEKGLDSVTSFLKACGCGSVAVISSGSEARRMIPHDDFDLILINTPLKDEFGHQLAVKLCESTCSGVILICKADLAEEMTNRTSDYGVCVQGKAFRFAGRTVTGDPHGKCLPPSFAGAAKGKQQASCQVRGTAVRFPCKVPADHGTRHVGRSCTPLH